MHKDKDKVLEELRSLLNIVSDNHKLSDFSIEYGFQRTYLMAIKNKQSQIINGKEYIKKGSYYSNKEVIKYLKRFIAREKL